MHVIGTVFQFNYFFDDIYLKMISKFRSLIFSHFNHFFDSTPVTHMFPNMGVIVTSAKLFAAYFSVFCTFCICLHTRFIIFSQVILYVLYMDIHIHVLLFFHFYFNIFIILILLLYSIHIY